MRSLLKPPCRSVGPRILGYGTLWGSLSILFLGFALPAESSEQGHLTFSELATKERMAVVNLRASQPLSLPGPIREFYGESSLLPGFEPLGTGFLISSDGYLLTNHHLLAGAVEKTGEVWVHLLDLRRMKARLVGHDAKTDIALLKIDSNGSLPHVRLGNSERLEVGEWVVAVGNPFGSEETVTVGIVSAIGRSIGSGPYDDFIQTDANIHAGNSGGPLFNIRDEVVGLSTALPGSGQGIGFAIPIDLVKQVAGQLRRDGRVRRAWLGVMIQEVTPELAEAFGMTRAEGALVSEVVAQSPAQTAGILRGDIIVAFDDKAVDRMHRLPLIVSQTSVGNEVEVALIRDGKSLRLRVKVAELPEEVNRQPHRNRR